MTYYNTQTYYQPVADVTITPQQFSTRDQILAKANSSGIDPSTLSIDSTGEVFGNDASTGASYILGQWIGTYNPFPLQSGQTGVSSSGNVLPGLASQGLILGIPWWVWAIIGVAAFTLTAKTNRTVD